MRQSEIISEYFEWLSNLVCEGRYTRSISFRKLLMRLHNIEFRYSIPRDKNRSDDGMDLRYRFAWLIGYEDSPDIVLEELSGPCSVLEMMIALSIRCEENIMDDPAKGNRTAQWFWNMVTNLGLGAMTDDRYDRIIVDRQIGRFLNREYDPDGKGGLFRIRNCDQDLRTVEIWRQLCWYLDGYT